MAQLGLLVALDVWIHAHWAQLIALGWAVEKVLEVVGQLGYKGSDNLGVILGKFLTRFSKPPGGNPTSMGPPGVPLS